MRESTGFFPSISARVVFRSTGFDGDSCRPDHAKQSGNAVCRWPEASALELSGCANGGGGSSERAGCSF